MATSESYHFKLDYLNNLYSTGILIKWFECRYLTLNSMSIMQCPPGISHSFLDT